MIDHGVALKEAETITVNFNVAFSTIPTVVISAQSAAGSTATQNDIVTNVSTSGFTVKSNNSRNGYSISWLAIDE